LAGAKGEEEGDGGYRINTKAQGEARRRSLSVSPKAEKPIVEAGRDERSSTTLVCE
jgi:hypothetical protein